jgi:hypothetical protein
MLFTWNDIFVDYSNPLSKYTQFRHAVRLLAFEQRPLELLPVVEFLELQALHGLLPLLFLPVAVRLGGGDPRPCCKKKCTPIRHGAGVSTAPERHISIPTFSGLKALQMRAERRDI